MGRMGLDLIYRGRPLKTFTYIKKTIFRRHIYINQFDSDTIQTFGQTDAFLRSLPHTSLAQRPYPLIPSVHPDARCVVSSLRRCVYSPTSLRLAATRLPQRRAPSPAGSSMLAPRAASSTPHSPPGPVCLAYLHRAASLPRQAHSPRPPPPSWQAVATSTEPASLYDGCSSKQARAIRFVWRRVRQRVARAAATQ